MKPARNCLFVHASVYLCVDCETATLGAVPYAKEGEMPYWTCGTQLDPRRILFFLKLIYGINYEVTNFLTGTSIFNID